jgi:hypothetical protein
MHTITKAAYEGDIVSRLRHWRGLHLAHSGELFEEAAEEIARLRLAVAECLSEKAADWKAACESAESASKEIGRLRLTDAERKAVEWAAWKALRTNPNERTRQAALRGLLERTSQQC